MLKRTSDDLWSLLGTYSSLSGHIKNGHVLHILHEEKMSLAGCVRVLCLREPKLSVGPGLLKTTIKHISDNLKKMKKHLDRDWGHVIAFLDQDFKYQPLHSPQATPTPSPVIPPPLLQSITPILPQPLSAISQTAPRPVATSTPAVPAHVSISSSRHKCKPCAWKRTALKNATNTISALRQELRTYKTLKQRNRDLQQKWKRSSQSAALWRQKYHQLKTSDSTHPQHPVHSSPLQVQDLAKENKCLKIGKAQLINSIHKKQTDYTAKLTSLEQQLSDAKKDICQLVEHNHYLLSLILEEAEADHAAIVTQQERAYGPELRKCVYKALISNVPVENVSAILLYFTETLAGKKLEAVPHQTNVSRMAYELGVLALLQAGEALHQCEVATLAFDATTIIDKHLNEFHIITYPPQQALTVSTSRFPGGRAFDYASHIVASLNEVANTYADAMKLDIVTFKEAVLKKLKSCLTDRAPVNHCVLQLLQTDLEVELLELNCNVHPLDGLASSARASLLQQDKQLKLKGASGKKGCAVAVIYNLSKLRYSYKGDPATFKSFLKENGVAPGVFLRYVGNRLHVLFHMAGVVIQHEQLLMTYLSRHTKNEVCKNLLANMKRPEVMVQLHALGLCGKIITGPWMTMVYGNASKLTNLEMVPVFQQAVQRLQRLQATPQLMETASQNIFGHPLRPEEDDVLQALQNRESCDLMRQTLKLLLSGFSDVLTRQLQEYLTGSLSAPTPEMLANTRSAPAHNIHAERALGMTDCLLRRAPNATIGFIDAKVKAKTNHTLEWLESKSSTEQEQPIRFAMRSGARVRKAAQHLEVSVDTEIKRGRLETLQKRDTADRRKLEQEIRQAIGESKSAEDHLFDPLGSDQKKYLSLLLSFPDQLVGRLFCHIWELEDGKQANFFGRIKGMRVKNKKNVLTISYWGQEENLSEDFDLTVEAVISDMVTGDLFFEA